MTRSIFSRFLSSALLLFITLTTIQAEDVNVDRDELASIGDQSINFINYVGPYEFINTLDQIRGIGRTLGEGITPRESSEVSIGNKYRILHIVSPEIAQGLDADIFIIEEDAAVDHINNLRTIIAGYLETVYGFSGRDAYLVAEFVTYYNAVHRGDVQMVKERYKAPVAEALNPEKIGLDTHYSNWPGKTEILIPLRAAGTAAALRDSSPVVDTGSISDEQVIEEMRKEEDMGIDSRQGMVELREDEIDRDQAKLDEQRADIQSREEAVDEELNALSAKEQSGEGLTPVEEENKAALEEEKVAIEEEKAAVEEEQSNIDQRTEEVLEMRDDISEDKNKQLSEQASESQSEEVFSSAPQITPVWFLLIDEEKDGIPFGRVVMYNLDDGKRMAVSTVTSVRGRTIAQLPESLLIIAGKDGGNGKVHLMLLDQNTLETTKEGSNEVFPGSLITVKDSDIYLVTMENGEWRLGKFNSSLVRTAVSDIAVEPWTSISFKGSSLFVQADSGEILRLSASTLKEEDRLE